ncbi:transposase, MuDR, MULE transposase domain protein, partial [Tanacetum coccineum]
MDGNNQIIPIVAGVSQGETGKSWTWFLRKLKECIGEVPNLAIISDRHYAITLACNTVFPNLFHGYCCRHLMMNDGMQSDNFKKLYWKTCKAYMPADIEKLMSDIHVLSGLPCGHVCAVARVEGLTSVNYLAKPWFLNKTIQGTYEGLFFPVKDVLTWQIPYEIQQVLPPDMGKKQSGKGEGPIINKCGRCGVKGHNRTACTVPLPKIQNMVRKKLKSTQQEESSQGNNYWSESQQEANNDVYQQCEMYEPQHVTNYTEDMYHPHQEYTDQYFMYQHNPQSTNLPMN